MKFSDWLRQYVVVLLDEEDKEAMEQIADILDECEKALDMALFSSGPSTNQRLEYALAKLRGDAQ